MTAIHKELAFEDAICAHLAANGWLYEPGAAARYDRPHALFPEDLANWLQQTQPDAWDSLVKTHGAATLAALSDRLRTALDKGGTLALLRDGLDVVGLRQRLVLCQFRPALGLNDETQARYAANRLRVVRQLRYSGTSENSIDLALFLNGIPVATAELKSDYTQSLTDAIDQYRYDRTPKSEPLLSFPGGALVHFAIATAGSPCAPAWLVRTACSYRSIAATSMAPATRPTRRARPPLIYGNRFGSATAGWRSLAATSYR